MFSKCCCLSLRNGSIMLGFFGILGGIAELIASKRNWFQILEAITILIAYGSLLYGGVKYNLLAVKINLILTAISIIDLQIGMSLGNFVISSIDELIPGYSTNCDEINYETLHTESRENHHSYSCDKVKWIKVGTFLFTEFSLIYIWRCIYCFYKELKDVKITRV